MTRFLWAGICGALGLIYFTLEAMLGRVEQGTSAEMQVLWLILCPICVVGAMIHDRAIQPSYTYRNACMTGIVTALYSSVALLLVWIVISLVLMPDYADLVVRGVQVRSQASGEIPFYTEQRVKMAGMLVKAPMIYVLGFVVPLLTGSITSVVAAIGLRKPPAS